MPLSTGYELIINSCEACLQIGLTENEQPLFFEEWQTKGKATEILAPVLANMFGLLKIYPSSLRRIACVNGPGSATGIRLALATAAAIRRVNGARIAAIDYMQALATSAAIRLLLLYASRIYVLTHARRNLVHFQAFISYGPQIPAQAEGELLLLTPEMAKKSINSGQACLCGSALKLYPDLFMPARTGEGPKDLPDATPLADLQNPSFEALRLLARHGDYFDRDIEPKYAGGCDALDNLDEIARRHGEDAIETRNTLERLLNRTPASNCE